MKNQLFVPVEENMVHGGVQKIYKFDNGYGASVVRHDFSYGNKKGLWELGVLKMGDDGEFHLCYDTPVSNNVEGWLSDEKVQALLEQIIILPKPVLAIESH